MLVRPGVEAARHVAQTRLAAGPKMVAPLHLSHALGVTRGTRLRPEITGIPRDLRREFLCRGAGRVFALVLSAGRQRLGREERQHHACRCEDREDRPRHPAPTRRRRCRRRRRPFVLLVVLLGGGRHDVAHSNRSPHYTRFGWLRTRRRRSPTLAPLSSAATF